jgi:hypothetical protein
MVLSKNSLMRIKKIIREKVAGKKPVQQRKNLKFE